MKRKVKRTMDGKEVVFLTPETLEEVAELERMEAEGKLDANHSFADYYNDGLVREGEVHPAAPAADLMSKR